MRVFDADATGRTLMISNSAPFCANGAPEPAASHPASDASALLAALTRTAHAIGTLSTPLAVVMDGLAADTGLGICVHAPIRIATEHTSICIPRSGLHPAAGLAWFLAKNIDGPAVGAYLALVGAHLHGMEAVLSGFATHFVPADRLAAMADALSGLKSADLRAVGAVVEDFVGNAPSAHEWNSWAISGDVRNTIDRCFDSLLLTDIVDRLAADKSAFAAHTLMQIQSRSPIALNVSAELLRRAPKLDFASYMNLELRLAWYFTHCVRDSATETLQWDEVVHDRGNKLSAIFGDTDANPNDIEASSEYTLYSSKTYKYYTHRTAVSVPSEDDIRRIVTGDASGAGSFAFTKQELVDWFAGNWGTFLDDEHLTPISVMDPLMGGSRYMDPNYHEGVSGVQGTKREKWGVRQRVEAVIERRCIEKDGYLRWRSSK
ncbi:hypothetical protein SeMB42_g03904 [Synchytrium endobioticum]|nr:hypothetical protein SeMB42_g03902 [Synchytrium endobioticum]TPX45701.1 hypothetical protein SeMB42_g03904 [Synchytrium endobioticum]